MSQTSKTFEELDEIGIQVSEDQAEVNEAREQKKMFVDVEGMEGTAEVKSRRSGKRGRRSSTGFQRGSPVDEHSVRQSVRRAGVRLTRRKRRSEDWKKQRSSLTITAEGKKERVTRGTDRFLRCREVATVMWVTCKAIAPGGSSIRRAIS